MIKLTLAFVVGAVVGGYVVKRIALAKAEGAAGGVIDSVFGKGSTYGGVAKTWANMYLENN